ncbi:hypothetical protein LSH36_33g08029 [Paralvinella palmiformis]|uniref:SET domain-containing protein n=1 Tax=Paralvinella palmiformis TaxID=53620 RepID=A0AAD9K9E4_9ANNE|nr:hypothetical protein LSH36_33g08029 [Paralvinella palmiformis]
MVSEEELLQHAWQGFIDDVASHYIDGDRIENSNWLRFVNTPTRHSHENVEGHFCYGKVFYRTKKDLYPGKELLVYHGDLFANRLNILNNYYD